tara:strand:- start:745 stop:2781 length:2037 start_codon:yes stop_codon:yes gene_type:complete
MKLTIDIENTVTRLPSGKILLDPFTPDNKLVLVCTKTDTGEEASYWFNHKTHTTEGAKDKLQEQLDNATVINCHNAQHELIWLWDCGFTYDGPVFDTMLVEYLLQRAQKQPLSLQAIAERYCLDNQKMDLMKEQLKAGVSVDEIDGDDLEEYCLADVKATQELSETLIKKLYTTQYSSLIPITSLTNELCRLLAKIYTRGFTIDTKVLSEVKIQFKKEHAEIARSLNSQVVSLMGDTPISLSSPEQLSMLIYSRKPIDKHDWATNFTAYTKKKQFTDQVKDKSSIIYKTKAIQCSACFGRGFNTARKKDGTLGKAKRLCKVCETKGILYLPQQRIAGLKFSAPSASWVSNHGFSTNKTNIELLETIAKRKGMTQAHDFLHNVRRLSALDTYLSSFVKGIETYMKKDGRLHVRLVQHRTTTGRLASDSPNLQNMPRGSTFPIKRVFKSRWEGGKIVEADFAQLEFRTAAFLGEDKLAKEEINTGFDVHSYTAKVISDAGQSTSRQEAKEHTFAPLFGATGYGKTSAEEAYYKQFIQKYEGIGAWHNRLANEVMSTGMVTTPTGRQFAFPDAKRRSNGGITYFTAVKNYPVQSVSTDIVQLTLLLVEDIIQKKSLKSMIVNSVHDSVVIDTHPDEEYQVQQCIKEVEHQLHSMLQIKFEMNFDVPLVMDCKIGDNWMEVA